MGVEVLAPFRHLAVELGDAVDDGHGQLLVVKVRARPSARDMGVNPSVSTMGWMSKALSSSRRRISSGRIRGRNGTYRRMDASAMSGDAGRLTMRGRRRPAAVATARTKSA